MSENREDLVMDKNERAGVTRRGALRGLAGLAAGAAATVLVGGCSGQAGSASSGSSSSAIAEGENWSEDGEVVTNVQRIVSPMRGCEDGHQPGVTGTQQNLQAVAFNMITDDREKVIKLLKEWTTAAENMCAGYPVKEPDAKKYSAPKDTGEAYDLGAAGLTISFGLGATFFQTEDGKDRFGLASIKPEKLDAAMRKFPGDYLNDEECGGDLFLLIAAEDPKVAFHAMRNMVRIAYGKASIKWNKVGYYHTISPEGYAHADRDLFGFRDGTTAPDAGTDEGAKIWDECAWIAAEDDPNGKLYEGGTYMMWRAFNMKFESWDEQTLQEQERVIGRTKLEGIPLSGGEDESATPDLDAVDADGNALIDPRSHIACFRSYLNESGHYMCRWGWNWSNGIDNLGQLQGGMYTGGMARDPEKDFYQYMDRWRDCDLTDYFKFTGSAVWLMLPGLKSDQEYIGQQLFEATA